MFQVSRFRFLVRKDLVTVQVQVSGFRFQAPWVNLLEGRPEPIETEAHWIMETWQ